MKQRKYNILFLGFLPYIGGTEISILLLLKHLDREAFNPTYVIPQVGPISDRLVDLDVRFVTMPLNTIIIFSPLGYLRTVWRLAQFIRKNKIDLVICTFELCNQFGLPAAKLNRIPIACHTRNLIYDLRSFWRTFLHFPDVLIANSKATAESYSPYVRKYKKVEVVYNGVDLEELSPSISRGSMRQRYNIGDNKFLVGMVGRISRPKRQDIFIKAVSEVVKICPDVRVLIVGDTKINKSENYLKELHGMVKELGLKDYVIFTGFVNDIKEVYISLDLLVLPSHAEPFGRVLIEAMAMEKPVVATMAGGAMEIVDNGKTGLLVPPDDSSALAKAIITMHNRKELARLMGKEGRKRVENMFSIKKNVERTQKIYLELLNRAQ
ncbi:glycosyltransferase family 4 protein [Thermodesulfobacteriota bacterium]